jgi:transposase-like protein
MEPSPSAVIVTAASQGGKRRGRRIHPDIKRQIIERIRNGQVDAKTAAAEHGLKPQAIYAWMAHLASSGGSQSELTKLRRESQLYLEIIGRLTVDLTVEKKKTAGA